MDWIALIGRNVRRRREALGLSQEQLAHDADIALRHLGNIERGKQNPSIAVVIALAEALQVQPHTLLMPEKAKG